MIDTEDLPTDFTRFRSMADRRGQIGEISKEQAALIGAAIKLLSVGQREDFQNPVLMIFLSRQQSKGRGMLAPSSLPI